jgi:hypothetical protein
VRRRPYNCEPEDITPCGNPASKYTEEFGNTALLQLTGSTLAVLFAAVTDTKTQHLGISFEVTAISCFCE